MPPKTKFSFTDIINAALDIVRREGMEKLTARAIAGELQSSTMPIYSCGKTMNEIEEEIIKICWDVLFEYQLKSFTEDPYIDMGIGYVLFAMREKNLFNCIHSSKHKKLNRKFAELNFSGHLARLGDYPPLSGVPDDVKVSIMMQGWIFCHGLADIMSKKIGEPLLGIRTDEDLKVFFNEANRKYFIGIQKVVEESRKKQDIPEKP